MTNHRPKPHVVILGAGFGGLAAARSLERAGLCVTVIDRQNHHLFQPLLYQVATGVLDASDIAAPIRSMVRGDDIVVLMGDASAVDLDSKKVKLEYDELDYDYLIVATGASHSYFGHEEWSTLAPGLKTIEDARDVRRRLFFAFEAAEREPNPDHRQAWLTFVVVGGGPTGVELSGALAEVSRRSLEHEFHNFDPADAKLILIEGQSRLLTEYPDELSEKAKRTLERRGVDVRTHTIVREMSDKGVLAGTTWIPARSVFWAAGVTASPLARTLGVPLDRAGRVHVTPELTVPGHPEVFVIGDMATIAQDGRPVPGVAPAAMQEGKHAAKNVVRAARGQPMLAFRYWDRGSFAVIGRGAAVGVALGRVKMSGAPAWCAWLAIHLFFLVGFRNRLSVLLNWASSYISKRRSAQLITAADLKMLPPMTEASSDTAWSGDRLERPVVH